MATQPPPPRPFTEAWVRQHFERSEGSRFFVEDMVVLAKQTREFQDVAEQTLSNQLRQCVESQLQASKSKHSHGVKPHFVGVAEKQAVGAGAGVPVREAATQRSRGQSDGTPGGDGSAQQEGGQQQMLAEPAGAALAAQAAAAAPSEEEEEGGRGHRAEAGASKRARGDEAGEETKRKASHGQRPCFVGVKRRVGTLAHDKLQPQLAAGIGRQSPADERPVPVEEEEDGEGKKDEGKEGAVKIKDDAHNIWGIYLMTDQVGEGYLKGFLARSEITHSSDEKEQEAMQVLRTCGACCYCHLFDIPTKRILTRFWYNPTACSQDSEGFDPWVPSAEGGAKW